MLRHLRFPALVLLAALVAAPATAQGDEKRPRDPTDGPLPQLERVGPPRTPPACIDVAVTDARDGDARDVFSATEVLDVEIRVTVPARLRGEHVLHLEITTPNGHLYERRAVPFTTAPLAGGETRRLPGYPQPLPVRGLEPAPDARARSTDRAGGTVAVRFPVAGTTIVASSLYGSWTVTASLDDDAAPCHPAVGFELTP